MSVSRESLGDLAKNLAAAIGEKHVQVDQGEDRPGGSTSSPLDQFQIDGRLPRVAVYPGSAVEVSTVLGLAASARQSVVVWGGGTHQSFGAIPDRYDIALATHRLNQIHEYSPESLTVGVGAGVAVARVNEVLGRGSQYLPVGVAYPDRATIGGLVAVGMAGAPRQRHGALRDRVIGIEVATPDGRVVRFGGRVVKNVAGYDLAKLYVGSFGTLGVITAATFKVTPLPASAAIVNARFASLGDALSLTHRIRTAPYVPEAFDLLSPAAAESVDLGSQHLVVVHLTGSPGVLERTRGEVVSWAETAGAVRIDVLMGEDIARTRSRLCEFGYRGGARLRVGVPPALEKAAFEHLEKIVASVRAHLGGGILHANVANYGDHEALARVVTSLRDWVTVCGGYVCVESCPPETKAILGNDGLWGITGPEVAIMRDLKKQLDPAGIMNPGRFAGRL